MSCGNRQRETRTGAERTRWPLLVETEKRKRKVFPRDGPSRFLIVAFDVCYYIKKSAKNKAYRTI